MQLVKLHTDNQFTKYELRLAFVSRLENIFK